MQIAGNKFRLIDKTSSRTKSHKHSRTIAPTPSCEQWYHSRCLRVFARTPRSIPCARPDGRARIRASASEWWAARCACFVRRRLSDCRREWWAPHATAFVHTCTRNANVIEYAKLCECTEAERRRRRRQYKWPRWASERPAKIIRL